MISSKEQAIGKLAELAPESEFSQQDRVRSYITSDQRRLFEHARPDQTKNRITLASRSKKVIAKAFVRLWRPEVEIVVIV